MSHAERLLKAEFDRQMLTPIAGIPAKRLMGCVYALLDTDQEALYVGKSVGVSETLGPRLSRHVPNGRSDAANKVFPPYEVRYIRIWLIVNNPPATAALSPQQIADVKAAEKHILWDLLSPPNPPFPPLNEDIPGAAPPTVSLPTHVDLDYWPTAAVQELSDLDARVARWSVSVSRLADRLRYGGPTPRLRSVQRRQITRLANLI